MSSINTFKSILFICLFIPESFLLAAENEQIILGDFSKQIHTIPKSWDALTFGSIDEYTSYTLVDDQNIKVIKAESKESASGLTKKN
jgi:hypothetical protein